MRRRFCWLAICLVASSIAAAQDRGRGNWGGERGDGDRSRGEWGESRDEGGGRRGWGGGGGPGDFLKRMDANGNGMIDPEESQGRAGFFLKRIAENNPDIDLSKPVPLEKLEQASAAARERWEVSRGGERPAESNSGSSGSSSSSSSSSAANKTPDRLVPGFGEPTAAAPVVPGFGLLSQALAVVRITDADRAEAQRRFGWFDSDGNGVIEGEEMERARSRDYHQYDSNNDGKLTIDEMAMRYAKRRVEEEAAAKAAAVASSGSSSSSSSSSRRDDERSSRDSGRGSSSSSRSSSSKSAAPKPFRIAAAEERLAKKGVPNWFLDKDQDGDGQVAMAEYGASWSESSLAEFAKFDLNGDGLITPEECLRAAKSSGSSSSSSRGSYASSRGGSSSSRSFGDRSYGSRTEVARAEPPKTTPPASTPKPTEAAADDDEDDEDEDDAEEETAEEDGGDDDAGGATAAATSTTGSAAAASDTSEGSGGVTSAKLNTQPAATAQLAADDSVAVDPRYLSYAQGRVKQFDTNGDGVLQPDEWIKLPKSPAVADINGDKRITPHELALYLQKQ